MFILSGQTETQFYMRLKSKLVVNGEWERICKVVVIIDGFEFLLLHYSEEIEGNHKEA
jgi:hypothetical protein